MRKLTKSLLAASFAAAVMSVSQAYAVTYGSDDLVLSFRAQWAGVDAQNNPINLYGDKDLSIDIGKLSSYTANNQLVGNFDLSGINGGSLDNIRFSVLAEQNTTGKSGTAFQWVTTARIGGSSDLTLKGTEDALQNDSRIGMGYAIAGIDGTLANAGLGLMSDNLGSSYHSMVSDAGNLGIFGTSVEGNTGVGFGIGSSSTIDMYYLSNLANGGHGDGAFVGSFTLNGDGSVYFNQITAVPEPSTCALLVGGGLLLFSTRRQFRKQS